MQLGLTVVYRLGVIEEETPPPQLGTDGAAEAPGPGDQDRFNAVGAGS